MDTLSKALEALQRAEKKDEDLAPWLSFIIVNCESFDVRMRTMAAQLLAEIDKDFETAWKALKNIDLFKKNSGSLAIDLICLKLERLASIAPLI